MSAPSFFLMALKSLSRDECLPVSNCRALTQREISLKRGSAAWTAMWRSVSAAGSLSCARSLASDRCMVPGASCASNQ
ncbi:hypothetical protein D9M68_528340 [compost metagenome]